MAGTRQESNPPTSLSSRDPACDPVALLTGVVVSDSKCRSDRGCGLRRQEGDRALELERDGDSPTPRDVFKSDKSDLVGRGGGFCAKSCVKTLLLASVGCSLVSPPSSPPTSEIRSSGTSVRGGGLIGRLRGDVLRKKAANSRVLSLFLGPRMGDRECTAGELTLSQRLSRRSWP